MAAIICNAGHRIVFCVPYYPADGPIEYVFNTIQGTLRINMEQILNMNTLIQELLNAIASIHSFKLYFVNCGFWRTV
jgi:hypothetical protein